MKKKNPDLPGSVHSYIVVFSKIERKKPSIGPVLDQIAKFPKNEEKSNRKNAVFTSTV